MPLRIPHKDIVIPNAREVQELLRADFETIERYLNNLPVKSTTLQVPGSPALSGAIVLNAGNGVNLSEVGQNITINATPSPARGFACYAAGTLAARTLQKFTVPSAALTQLDVYFETAPVGVNGASCANLFIHGTTSGSLTMPFSTATPEYHLKVTPGIFGAQTSTTAAITTGAFGDNVLGIQLSPTASGQVGSFDLNLTQVTPVAGEFVRAGFVAGNISSGTAPPAFSSLTWLTDTTGAPGYIDIPVSSLPGAGSGVLTTWQLTDPVNLTGSAAYTLLFVKLNPTKTGYGSSVLNFEFVTHANATYINNLTSSSLRRDIAGAWQGDFGDDLVFDLYGAGTGLSMSGLVQVDITMTGAPATPGADANISLQM